MILSNDKRESGEEYKLAPGDKVLLSSLTNYELTLLLMGGSDKSVRKLSVAFNKKLNVLSSILAQNEAVFSLIRENLPDFNNSVDSFTGKVSELVGRDAPLITKLKEANKLMLSEDVEMMNLVGLIDKESTSIEALMDTRFSMRVKSSLVRLFYHLDQVYYVFIKHAERELSRRSRIEHNQDPMMGKELVHELDQALFSVGENFIIGLSGLDEGYQKAISSHYYDI